MRVTIHPIEIESYRRLAERIDLSQLPAGVRTVVERTIHATADPSFADSMVLDEASVGAGIDALRAGAPIVADVEMVRAGMTSPASCFLDAARSARKSSGSGHEPTLSALAVRLAAEAHPDGAVFVIGCAPTALDELVSLVLDGVVRPALVVGVPVGFVGASESKERLRSVPQSLLRSISNVGERGGSPVAASIMNALSRLAGATPLGGEELEAGTETAG